MAKKKRDLLKICILLKNVSGFSWILVAMSSFLDDTNTPPMFNSEFTPEKWWLEDDPFLLGPGNFSGAMLNFGMVDFEDDGTYQIAKCQRSYHFHHHLWCSYCISMVIVAPKSFTVFQLVKRDVFTSLVLGQSIYIDETQKQKKHPSLDTPPSYVVVNTHTVPPHECARVFVQSLPDTLDLSIHPLPVTTSIF